MIDFDQVLYADRYMLQQRRLLGKKRALLSAVKQLFFTCFRFPDKRKADFLFFRSLVREDYKTFFHQVYSTVDRDRRVVVEDYVRDSKRIAPRAFLTLFLLLPQFFSFKAGDVFERLYLYLRLCFYYRQLAAVSKMGFKHLVLFADMQPVENLLAQYFGQRGKNTVTLQHGLYVDYEEYATVNVINYLCQPSEYFLSWGGHTEELIKKYHCQRKVVICGKTSINLAIPKALALPSSVSEGQPFFTVILDQNIFEEYNKKMLGILAEYADAQAMEMNVKFHPGNNRRNYMALGVRFTDNLPIEKSAFVVGHTSSLLYELMLLDVPTYKFYSDIPCVPLPTDIVFQTAGQLKQLTEAVHDFGGIAKQYISFVGEESKSRYRDFFLSLS